MRARLLATDGRGAAAAGDAGCRRRSDHAPVAGPRRHAVHGLLGRPRDGDLARSASRSSTSSTATPAARARGCSSGCPGPPVDGTGVGPGLLRLADLLPATTRAPPRNAGAISESIGEYGGDVVLATPIEAILGDAGRRARSRRRARVARRARRAMRARAKPLATPLTVTRRERRAGPRARARRPREGRPPGDRGARRARSARSRRSRCARAPRSASRYSMGDIQVGAIGTVAYADGDRVWAFGHPFEGAGARARCCSRTPTSSA